MASKPGIFTNWPWTPLASYKYVILAPLGIYSIYSYLTKGDDADLTLLILIPFALLRMLHNQLWISLCRYRNARGDNVIVDKGIDFEQVDRERNWDDEIIWNCLLSYLVNWRMEGARKLPFWRTDGIIITALIHMGPVEFLYYWFHRALHHHFLYSRYHSHHHSSIVTQPITSVVHPFAENLVYSLLFFMPMVATIYTRTSSLMSTAGYIIYIDVMNNMGHSNFEFLPNFLFSLFPPLKYLVYTPSYHSLHHTQFRTNYSLFMPFYDYIYGTMDKSTDKLYKTSLEKPHKSPDVVYLTHLTTPSSIYHLRLGFASLASKPLGPKWYLVLLWPVTAWSMLMTWIYGRTFVVERNTFHKLGIQSWFIPRYTMHYTLQRKSTDINKLIEEAILDAEDKGVKVLALGLLNQSEELNGNGKLYLEKWPKLKLKIVDGSSLAVAVILNTIPTRTTRLLFRAKLSKVAYSLISQLCHGGIQVLTWSKYDHEKLTLSMPPEQQTNVVLSKDYSCKVWLVDEDLSKNDQAMAPPGTIFIPISQFPPNMTRKNCTYRSTPAMLAPSSLTNMHSCENWLPRRAMSAWRVAGIIHAMEGWNVDECGDTIFDIEQVWKASISHGFRPLP